MKFIAMIGAVGTATLLSGCMQGDDGGADAAIAAQLSGRTLVNVANGARISANADGTLVGEGVEGTWHIKDGEWCRTIVKPEKIAGSLCQGLSINGVTMTLARADGSIGTYTIE